MRQGTNQASPSDPHGQTRQVDAQANPLRQLKVTLCRWEMDLQETAIPTRQVQEWGRLLGLRRTLINLATGMVLERIAGRHTALGTPAAPRWNQRGRGLLSLFAAVAA